jgi:hypothetical protein
LTTSKPEAATISSALRGRPARGRRGKGAPPPHR